MGRRTYPVRPDGPAVLDADRGASTPQAKTAVPVSIDEAAAREDSRAGLRDLDRMTEGGSGLSRQQRDAARIMPRATTAHLGHPRMERQLPDPDALRRPPSGRQQKARCKTTRDVQSRLPSTQRRALAGLMSAETGDWRTLNSVLAAETGDVDSLNDNDRQKVKRLDRVIQAYERANDRGHVVYANVTMPAAINRTSLLAYVTAQFQLGDQLAFDQYTGGSLGLHEASQAADPAGRLAVFEIQTRRGIYLGRSEGTDNTGFLLPRGMQFEVVGTHVARYSDRAGNTGSRVVIQLLDTTPEPSEGGR